MRARFSACVASALALAGCGGGGAMNDAGPDGSTDVATGPDCACVPDVGPKPNATTLSILNASGTAIASWPIGASGDVAPATVVAGGATNLDHAIALAVDGQGNLYAATQLALLVFPPGASGNVAPARTIAGPNALVATDYFAGLAVAADGTIIAVSELTSGVNRNPKILVFSPGANGNVAPAQTITGAATTMQATLAMGVFSNDIAEADATQAVNFFPTSATGNVAPQRSLKTGAGIADGLAFGELGNLFVALYGFSSSSVVEYAPGAQNTDTPIATIAGAATGITSVAGVAVDVLGNVFVANADPAGAAILVFPPSSTGNVAPSRSIAGASTTLAGDASQYPMPLVVH